MRRARRWSVPVLVLAGAGVLAMGSGPAAAADAAQSCKDRGLGATTEFIGEAVSRQGDTVTFAVSAVKLGALDGRMATVEFSTDSRYLHLGRQYDVSARTAPRGVAQSFVGGPDAPPRLEARVKADADACFTTTRFADGSTVDTGILSPLLAEWRQVLLAVVTPVVAVMLVLALLVMLKRLLVRVRWRHYA
jgi:hypothetical protein